MLNIRGVALLISITVMMLPVAGSADQEEGVSVQQIPGVEDNFLDLGFRRPPITRLPDFGSQLAYFGRTSFRPWNGSYWPTHKGMLGHRYADPGAPKSKKWHTNYQYYLSHPSSSYVSSGRIDSLSPAEKYDLLLEDSSWTLTRHMWNKGLKVAQMYGGVPGWFGICHGWAAASHMRIDEPGLPFYARSVNGNYRIKFYPNDVKALLSYLWAESAPKSLFIGKRCREGRPKTDASGRVTDEACFDNNPMTWHLAILNRIGRDGDSIVMDSSMNGEVWNYAVDSYFFRYFNPRTLRPTKSWKEATIERGKFMSDPYKEHRSPDTKYIVGVVMDVFFPAATEPRAASRAGGQNIYKHKKFVYDLELDQNHTIIGGEWHSKDRSDFLWTFPYDARAMANSDRSVSSTWSLGSPLPQDWATAGKNAAEYGKVLGHIANALHERSFSPVEVELPVEVEPEPVPEPMPGTNVEEPELP